MKMMVIQCKVPGAFTCFRFPVLTSLQNPSPWEAQGGLRVGFVGSSFASPHLYSTLAMFFPECVAGAILWVAWHVGL